MSVADAVAASDVTRALREFDAALAGGSDPWELHLSLFPVAQRVLNPPFINPHLPKMHAICRELVPVAGPSGVAPLVRLEVQEYARRPKLAEIPAGKTKTGKDFARIEEALAGEDVGETARRMADFWEEVGPEEFARRLLLLGSGYLEESLGHSISCTAFILLEAMAREDREPWPVFVLLADYFHKGRFIATPPLRTDPVAEEDMERHLLRAASGRGIVDLHDVITIYAVDRVSGLFDRGERNHLLRAWIDFLGEKEAAKVPVEPAGGTGFRAAFASRETGAALAAGAPLLGSAEGRATLAQELVWGVCDAYNGAYNPHNLTGLGSLLWLIDRYDHRRALGATALYQYLDYFFAELRKAPAG